MKLYYLSDGRSFIHDPETASDRDAKKAFIISLNIFDLRKDKTWTADAVRALGKGMVDICPGKGKRATKGDVLDALEEYQKEQARVDERVIAHLNDLWSDTSFSPKAILRIIETGLTGDDLVSQLAVYGNRLGYADSTKAKDLTTDICKVLQVHYQHHDKVEVIRNMRKVWAAERKAVDDAYFRKTKEANANKKPVNIKSLFDFSLAVIEAPEKYSWKELSIALALLTGRRMGELHGDHSIFKSSSRDGYIVFEGQLKVKGREGIEAYDIPVLGAPEKVLEALRILRETKSMSKDLVNRTIGKSLSTELPKHILMMKKEAGITEYKDFRACYANICWVKLVPDSDKVKTDMDIYISSILGHGKDDKGTAKSYEKLYIADISSIEIA